MKTIKLTQGKFTRVDDQDFDYLNQWRWAFDSSTGYAMRTDYNGGNPKKIYLHRVLIKSEGGLEIDHIDGVKLNNTRNNLRIVTHKQNNINKGLTIANKTGHSGVSFDRFENKWRASLVLDGKQVFSKRFKEFDDAVLARKVAEDIYFGEYKRKR